MNKDDGQMFRFIVSGIANTLFGYGIYALFILANVPLWLCVVGSLIAGVMFNFLTYGGFVFKIYSRLHFFVFSLFYIALALCNYVLLKALIYYGFSTYLAQFVLLTPLAILSYCGLKWGVFGTWTKSLQAHRSQKLAQNHNSEAPSAHGIEHANEDGV